MNADGSFTYTPNANYNGQDSYTYTISDGNGGTDTATVNIGVTPVDDNILSDADEVVNRNESSDVTVNANILANTVNPDGPSTETVQSVDSIDFTDGSGAPLAGFVVTALPTPVGGIAAYTITNSVGISATLTVMENGALNISNPNNVFGEAGNGEYTNMAVNYTVTDGEDVDSSTFMLRVCNWEQDPNAVDDAYTTDEDVTLVINPAGILSNDSDPDGDTLAVSSYTQPSNGSVTVNPDGSFTYIPNANYNGPDTYTYTMTDGNGNFDTATVRITVNPDDDPIITETDVIGVDETGLGAVITDNGTLSANFGNDGPGTFAATDASSFSFGGSVAGGALTSDGVPVVVTLSGNTYTGTAGTEVVFTLAIQSNGSYEYQQFIAMDHADVNDPDDQMTLNFGFKAIDSDGEEAVSSLSVNVNDDAPVANNDHNLFTGNSTSGHVITGVNGGVGAVDDIGADEPGQVTSVTYNGVIYTIPAGGSVTVNATYGDLVMNNDGSYTYDLNGTSGSGITYGLHPTSSDTSGSSDTFTKNGITISTMESGQDLYWRTVSGEDGIGISGNGTSKVYGNREGINADFATNVDNVTVKIGDVGSNNVGKPFDVTVHFADGTSATQEFALDNPNAEEVVTLTFNSSDFGFSNKAIDSVDLYSHSDVGPTSGKVSWLLVDVEGSTSGEVGSDVFTYGIVDADGDPASATLTFDPQHVAQPQPPVVEITPNGTGVVSEMDCIELHHQFDVNTTPFPVVREGARLDPIDVHGTSSSNMTAQFDTTATVHFVSEGAGYHNLLGSYLVNPTTGEIQDVQVLSPNFSAQGSGGSLQTGDLLAEIDVPNGYELGFFLMADGYDATNSMGLIDPASGHLEFRNSAGDIASATDSDASLFYVPNTAGSHAIDLSEIRTYHSNYPDLNPDNLEHTTSGLNSNDDLRIGFEDLFYLGDKDYEDAIFDVSFTPTKSFILSDTPISTGDTEVVITDVDSANLQRAVIEISQGYQSGDVLKLSPGTSTSINVVSNGFNGSTYQIVLEGVAPIASYQSVIQGLIFGSDSSSPSGGTRYFSVQVEDDSGLTSNLEDQYILVVESYEIGDASSNALAGDRSSDMVNGQDGDDILDGNAGDDILLGGNGNDILTGGAGDDVLMGGMGDDIINTDLNDLRIDGGAGFDTLNIEAGPTPAQINASTDLHDVTGIDRIDLSNGQTGDNVSLTTSDIVRISDNGTLFVKGDSGDEVSATEFTVRGSDTTDAEGTVFASYTNGDGSADLYVELGLMFNDNVVTEE